MHAANTYLPGCEILVSLFVLKVEGPHFTPTCVFSGELIILKSKRILDYCDLSNIPMLSTVHVLVQFIYQLKALRLLLCYMIGD